MMLKVKQAALLGSVEAINRGRQPCQDHAYRSYSIDLPSYRPELSNFLGAFGLP
jgi:hypothetical protein